MLNVSDLKNDRNARAFHDDFRRALLMHRKGRLGFFAKLILPDMGDQEVSDVEILNALDYRVWLTPALLHKSRSEQAR